jgi:hypothetical protein
MINQIIIACIGLALILVFGFLAILRLQTTEAFEWWKPFKYEKWNCCPNANFSIKSNPEPNNHNGLIQNIEINQMCENVQTCLVNLHDLNSQIAYIN